MRLLFEDLARKHFTSDRVQKLKSWVEHANSARKSGNLDAFANQYDKAEELITFYAFAPLAIRNDKAYILNELLSTLKVNETARGEVSIAFEKLLQPPEGYLSWIEHEISKHPAKYVRDQAKDHKNGKKPLETETHVDAFIETDNLLILVEMKFISDISYQTTFNPARNQLARLIDVGIQIARNKSKPLILLLSSPTELFESKNRLYYYKIKEYYSYTEIQKDICWRKQEDIEKNLLAVKWIPLKELIKISYKDFSHPDKEEAMDFFRERNIA